MSSRPTPRPPSPLGSIATIPWVIAIAAVVGCIALAAWTTILRSDLEDADARVAALTDERNQLREAATASVYELTPTAEGPGDAHGTMYLTASGSGVLSVVNLPAPEDGQAYQVWFLPPEEGAPVPGATFGVDDNGVGLVLIAADTGAFRGVAISQEPLAGSAAPTGPMLLSGAAAGARG